MALLLKHMFQEHVLVLVLGNAMLLVRRHLCNWKNHIRFGLDAKHFRNSFVNKNLRSGIRVFVKRNDISISCSASNGKELFIHGNEKLKDARVIYAVAPAMGHNQV